MTTWQCGKYLSVTWCDHPFEKSKLCPWLHKKCFGKVDVFLLILESLAKKHLETAMRGFHITPALESKSTSSIKFLGQNLSDLSKPKINIKTIVYVPFCGRHHPSLLWERMDGSWLPSHHQGHHQACYKNNQCTIFFKLQ